MGSKLDALTPLMEAVSNLELSIQVMSEKYDEVLSYMEWHSNEINNLKMRLDVIERRSQEETIKQLQIGMQKLEWRCRYLNLEYYGIPKSENEDLLVKVIPLAATNLDFSELTGNKVVAIHRLPSRNNNVPGVIAPFTSQHTRESSLDRKNRQRGTDRYISEKMSTQMRRLFATVRNWAKQSGNAYTWYNNEKLFLRKKKRDQTIVIRKSDDLEMLDD